MSLFDYPSGMPLVDDNKMATSAWSSTFSRWQNLILTIQSAGTTAQRPTSLLWIGRQYFDTTLGKPIYLKAVRPSVWVDGAGTVS